MRVDLSFVSAYLAAPDHPLDQRVILGEQAEGPLAEQVSAAVAYMGQVEGVTVNERRGQRGTHTLDGSVFGRTLEDGTVRLLDLLDQRTHSILLARVFQGLERQAGRDLATSMTAHPVGHDEQRLRDQVSVLVTFSDLPDVGNGADLDLHRCSSNSVCPTLIRSPA